MLSQTLALALIGIKMYFARKSVTLRDWELIGCHLCISFFIHMGSHACERARWRCDAPLDVATSSAALPPRPHGRWPPRRRFLSVSAETKRGLDGQPPFSLARNA